MEELFDNEDDGDDLKKTRYEKNRARLAKKFKENSAAGRDIAPLPPIGNVDRRNSCLDSFRLFCETYGPERFFYKWSPDHLKVIAKIEASVLVGGRFALAMPRSNGKSNLCEYAALWAILYGHRAYVILIGSTDEKAGELLASIKSELENNELLLEDFPEVCYPIRRLERQVNLANRQTLEGQYTRIKWLSDKIQMPNVAGSACAGSVIRSVGLTGDIRGKKEQLPSGKSLRPDLVVLDDPQTDESAISPIQNKNRLKIITSAVLGLGGLKRRIACLMPCTVIAAGDMVEKCLENPEWNAERMKMLYELPKNLAKWDEYADIRRLKGQAAATEMYKADRAAMDEGAVAAWEANHFEDEISAIQHAMNLRIQDFEVFQAEYQNEPLKTVLGDGVKEFSIEAICRRINGVPRLIVPRDSIHLTAFIDPHPGIHYATVCAWNPDFGGAVIDSFTWPRQNRSMFAHDDARPTLADIYKRDDGKPLGDDAQLMYAGLVELTREILGRSYFPEQGGEMKVERCGIDSGYETDMIYRFVRASPFAAILFPTKGFSRTMTAKPMSEWKVPQGGKRFGDGCMLTRPESGRGRVLRIDTDFVKSEVHKAMTTALGAKDCFQVFGSEMRAQELLATHCWAEYGKLVKEEWYKWDCRVGINDNHFFDTIVGNFALANTLGLKRNPDVKGDSLKPQSEQAVRLSDLQRQRRSAVRRR